MGNDEIGRVKSKSGGMEEQGVEEEIEGGINNSKDLSKKGRMESYLLL